MKWNVFMKLYFFFEERVDIVFLWITAVKSAGLSAIKHQELFAGGPENIFMFIAIAVFIIDTAVLRVIRALLIVILVARLIIVVVITKLKKFNIKIIIIRYIIVIIFIKW